jgi:dephospho-CoA kinase
MTFKLGLTGSIGMGKSTTAQMFAELGIPVWDADAAVHKLYSTGGAAVPAIQELYPEAVEHGEVSRPELKRLIQSNEHVLGELERIVHPFVTADRQNFIETSDSDIVLLDIPLLFETNGDKRMDAIACVNIDAKTQRERVLQRGTMTEEQFEQILNKQLPNDLKCSQSDFVIQTDNLDHAKEQVAHIIELIRKDYINA